MDTDGNSVDAICGRVATQLNALSDAELIYRVRALLGGRLVAYLVGASSTETVSSYASGRVAVPREAIDRVRHAYRIAELQHRLGAAPDLIQAWFQGRNPRLRDRAPARVLVEQGDRDEDTLIAAAVALLSS